MNKVLYFGLVIGAAAAGAVAAWYLTKDKAEKEADARSHEEYIQMKKAFEAKTAKDKPEDLDIYKSEAESPKPKNKVKQMVEYQNICKKYEKKPEAPKKPFVISPDDFGENPGYDHIYLTMYADHIIADENDEIVEDADECIGLENLSHMGEYDADILHIQNDKLHVYYEITRDLRNYMDVVGELPTYPGVT